MKNPCDIWELDKVHKVPSADCHEEYWQLEYEKGSPEAIEE